MEQGCQLSPFTIFTVEISERFCCSPARHSEIILVTLGLPTVPTLDHGICQWNRKMDDHTPAMWNLLEVSQCLLQCKCPAVFLHSKTNNTMLKISCVLKHIYIPSILFPLFLNYKNKWNWTLTKWEDFLLVLILYSLIILGYM